MQGKSSDLQGGQELSKIKIKDFDNGNLLDRIISAVNQLAKNANVAAVGKLQPPAPVDSIQVQGVQNGNTLVAPSEHLHFVLTHNASVDKGAHYISEIATEPNFLQPHIIDHGCSRSGFVHLPAFQNDGTTPQNYFLRSYVQYRGSDASKHTTFGGTAGATKIQMTGTSASTLLPSTGSGTASATGQQGGKGFGTDLSRSAPGPKRSIPDPIQVLFHNKG